MRIAYGPYKAMQYSYVNDLLVIRSVSFDVTHPTPSVTGQQFYFVEPVYRDASPSEIAAIPTHTLNSRNLCIYVLLPTPKGVAVLAAVHRKSYPTDESWVTFDETPAGVTGVRVEQDFLQVVAEEIVRGLQPTS